MPSRSAPQTAPSVPPGLWPGLWVVATPIGNLADLSPRARLALEHAAAILCEDTRRTSQLLTALGISGKRLERLDAHATPDRISTVVEYLERGDSLALVSDAGTPAISDPGARLVQAAREAGVRVVPLPGPSAPAALLSVAGFPGFEGDCAYAFRGFFPRKAGERQEELERARAGGLARTCVWFESPERIGEVLGFWAQSAPETRVAAGKELTKLHERVFEGTAAQVASDVAQELEREGSRGEWCFAVAWPSLDTSAAKPENATIASAGESWVIALRCLIDARVSASEAARQVSQHFGVSRKLVYQEALTLSGKKSSEGG